MNRDDRRDNLLGAFVLSVSDRLRRETEAAIGHTGASAAGLIIVAEFPDRTIEFLRKAIGLSHPATVRVVDRLVEQGLVRRLSPAESDVLVAILERALGHLSESPGTTHCRLCDMRRCPRSDCPVIQTQIELGATPPEAVPVPG
jgi:hypothetical protein